MIEIGEVRGQFTIVARVNSYAWRVRCICGVEGNKQAHQFENGSTVRGCLCLRSKRFWEKVDKTGDCWLWTGYCMVNGYGTVMYGRGHKELVHRVSWEIAHGEQATRG